MSKNLKTVPASHYQDVVATMPLSEMPPALPKPGVYAAFLDASLGGRRVWA